MNEGALIQPSFSGSKQRPLMKKEATKKRKGLKTKISIEKRGVKVVYDTFPRTTTRVAHEGSLIGGTKALDTQAG
jgi:hypothetical protein